MTRLLRSEESSGTVLIYFGSEPTERVGERACSLSCESEVRDAFSERVGTPIFSQ